VINPASATRRWLPRRRWLRYALYAVGAYAVMSGLALTFLYLSFARLIDERLHGERERVLPRVYARPVELRRGQMLSDQDLVARLNDLGYAQRPEAARPGEFAVQPRAVTFLPRGGELAGTPVRVTFAPRPAARRGAPAPASGRGIRDIEVGGAERRAAIHVDAPLLTALMTSGAREKRRRVPLSAIPPRVREAVITIEDQGFYSHPGVNPFRLAVAVLTNWFGGRSRPVGYSTITQQLARMFFLADEFNEELASGERGRTWASYWRKAREIVMSIVLERRASKDEILELYLNDVYLGQRGSFAVHGVAEASRLFFGRDVANVTLGQAALLAGLIRNPGSGSPFANARRATERRNVVLRAMAAQGYISESEATRASREGLGLVTRALDNEAPYFVDLVSQQVAELFPGATDGPGPVDVHTTLDLNLQRAALDAVRAGLARVDSLLARRRRPEPAQAALIAVDPRTGDILAMVGGRSYNQSQYNRAVAARRQPGSAFKPFVFLAAFEYAADQELTDLTPASLTLDEPATFTFDEQVWEPKNYDDYDGEITWRRALALSRNLGTIRVGERIGFDKVADLWRRVGVGTPPRGYPSITLGVFELTPLEVARAYTLFVNGGAVRPLRAIDRVDAGGRQLRPPDGRLVPVARPDTTYLVTNMLRSVIDEGTGAGARAAGFTLDAAGKTGTTNDLRDAWFVGFTPELLAIVWVGHDNNQPLGLSGAQAAVPIWADFMKAALAGRPNVPFEVPDGISFAEIDPDTGRLAAPACPRVITEAFLWGSEPVEFCPLHR
jgi:penicillin-binding protein 1B